MNNDKYKFIQYQHDPYSHWNNLFNDIADTEAETNVVKQSPSHSRIPVKVDDWSFLSILFLMISFK